jgi:hypothetical protein
VPLVISKVETSKALALLPQKSAHAGCSSIDAAPKCAPFSADHNRKVRPTSFLIANYFGESEYLLDFCVFIGVVAGEKLVNQITVAAVYQYRIEAAALRRCKRTMSPNLSVVSV